MGSKYFAAEEYIFFNILDPVFELHVLETKMGFVSGLFNTYAYNVR